MGRPRAPRKAYRPRPVDSNPVELAIANAATVPAHAKASLLDRMREAFAAFRSGRGTAAYWADLADAMNVAEALAELGIANDHEQTLQAAQRALAAVCQRQERTRSWTLYPGEITALDDATWLHEVQLEHCSQRELRTAIETVQRRVRGALAGSARAGALICNPGHLGRSA